MTFSLLARCAQTGAFGAAVTTSGIAVGARVAFCAAGVGGVLTQHRTDPRLGPRGLALLRSGCSAAETVAGLVASTPHHRFRQLAVMDAAGETAHFDGALVKPERGVAFGQDVVAIGNILSSSAVPQAMADAFTASAGELLAERLLRALEAGEAAGGEHGAIRSAHILVVERESFPLVDLRIDWAEAPLPAMRALWEDYRPELRDYVMRALDPENCVPQVPR